MTALQIPKGIMDTVSELPNLNDEHLSQFIRNKDEESIEFFLKHYTYKQTSINTIVLISCQTQWARGIELVAQNQKNLYWMNSLDLHYQARSGIVDFIFDNQNPIYQKIKNHNDFRKQQAKKFIDIINHDSFLWSLRDNFISSLCKHLDNYIYETIESLITENYSNSNIAKETLINLAQNHIISPVKILLIQTDVLNNLEREQLKKLIQESSLYSLEAKLMLALHKDTLKHNNKQFLKEIKTPTLIKLNDYFDFDEFLELIDKINEKNGDDYNVETLKEKTNHLLNEKNEIKVYELLKVLEQIGTERFPFYKFDQDELRTNMEAILANEIKPNTLKQNQFKRF